MKLTVTLRDEDYIEYPIFFDYATNERGELDIIDSQNVTIATFNANCWVSVYRDKEDNENWPDHLLEKEPDPSPVLGADIDGSSLGYTVKIPGMEREDSGEVPREEKDSL